MIIHNYNGLGTTLDIDVNDRSYRLRQVMGEDSLYLYFSLAEYTDIRVGSYVDYEGQRYYLHKPNNFKKHHTRNYEYSLILSGDIGSLEKYKVRDVAEKRLKFPLTAKPQQHLQMLVDNLNMRESGWTMGDCIDAPEKLISYNHTDLREALQMIADEFETEWEVKNKTIHLRKVEYNYEHPLALSYGKGNGFKSGLGRSNVDEKTAIEILHVQGGERNINFSKYGSKELLLPKGQTLTYEGREYIASLDGLSIQRADKPIVSGVEDSLDLTNIYPKREGEISGVIVSNAEKNFYDFIDNSIPNNLNYNTCQIEGEKMTVVFQTGMLAGREFDISRYTHATRKFEIVSAEQDGMTLPNDTFKPAVDDKYAIFGIHLPDAYIRDDATKTGASWEMFKDAVKYLYEHETPRFTFTGELDGIWAKKDWLNIGGKIVLGGYVNFSDTNFQPTGSLIRIVGIKDYINNPHSPEIDLSNNVVSSSFSSQMAKIKQNEVVQEELHRQSISYAKRRYRDSVETLEMLEGAFTDKFTNAISPVTVKTMAALIGDESLQFRFVNNTTTPTEVAHTVTFNPGTKILTAPAGIMQHLTLGIETISPSHKASEYKYWNVAKFTSPPLTDALKSYYLYIKANKSNASATFYMSETPIGMEEVSGYYHFLTGTLNAESDGDRSYTSLYGYTEILPGRITAKEFVSPSGDMSINLQTGDIQGNFKFTSGKTVEQGIADAVDAIEVGGEQLLSGTDSGEGWGYSSFDSETRTFTRETTGTSEVFVYKNGNTLQPNTTYTLSAYIKSNGYVKSFDLYCLTADYINIHSKVLLPIPINEWVFESLTFTTKADGDYSDTRIRFDNNGSIISGVNAILYVRDIKLEKGNVATDWSRSAEDVQAEIDGISQQALQAQTSANTANSAVGSLNTYVDGAFKDGVISNAEAKAIEKYINSVNEIMAKAESSYNKVYTNTYLEGSAKTTLLNAKINLWGRRDSLISAINTAIAGGTTASYQKTAVDTAFINFNSNMTAFTNALEEANKAIQVKLDNLSKGYVNDLEIGGKNLLVGTSFETLPTKWGNPTLSTIFETGQPNAVRAAYVSGKNYGIVTDKKTTFEAGQTYTLSFELRTSSIDSMGYLYVIGASNWRLSNPTTSISITTDGEWHHYKRTFLYDGETRTNAGFLIGAIRTFGYFDIRKVKIEKGSKATDWEVSQEDLQSEIKSLEYLKEAIEDGSTDILGGLVATNLLMMKDTDGTQTGGLSGLKDDNIGFWTGGTYAQALADIAKVIFRKDGSGQLAGGLIKFLENGGLQVGDFDIDGSGTLLIKDGNDDRVMITKGNITTLNAIANLTQDNTVSNSGLTFEHSGSDGDSDSRTLSNTIVVNNDNTKLTINANITSVARLIIEIGVSSAGNEVELLLLRNGSLHTNLGRASSMSASSSYGQPSTNNINRSIYVSSGTYSLRLRSTVNSMPKGRSVEGKATISSSSMRVQFDGAKRITEIGRNGVGIIANKDNYSFFGVEGGVYKAVEKVSNSAYYDKPGVLLSGHMTSGGSIASSFGSRLRSGSQKTGTAGEYQINHNIGHQGYHILITPTSNVTVRVTNKSNTYFRVRSNNNSDMAFEFLCVGNNHI